MFHYIWKRDDTSVESGDKHLIFSPPLIYVYAICMSNFVKKIIYELVFQLKTYCTERFQWKCNILLKFIQSADAYIQWPRSSKQNIVSNVDEIKTKSI